MEIKRIDTYCDGRFSQTVLNQHGCFLVNGKDPYEVEIISPFEAVVRGADTSLFSEIIDEFRFYTPHITSFYDEQGRIVNKFEPMPVFSVPIEDIQPSQFFVDEDKVAAIRHFIKKWDDIIIQVIPYGNRYISLDGHTHLYYAVQMGFGTVKAVIASSDEWIYAFADEAVKRNVRSPKDLILLSHEAYEVKWNQFCDAFFAEK